MGSKDPGPNTLADCGLWHSSVFDGMTELCKTFFPNDLKQVQQNLLKQPDANGDAGRDIGQQKEDEDDAEDEAEEEEEEEEDEEKKLPWGKEHEKVTLHV